MKQEGKRLHSRFVVYNLLIAFVTTGVFVVYLLLASQNHFSELEPMVSGTAARPYVYRVLAPLIIRLLSAVTGLSMDVGAIAVMYLSLMGFSFTMTALARIYFPANLSQPFSLLAPIGLIPLLIEQRHIYDFTTLFLVALALYFLAKNRFTAYLVTLLFAALSKETALFLTLFYLWHFRKMERKKFIGLALIQVAIYGCVRLATMLVFRNNPGGVMEFHWFDQIAAYRQNPLGALVFFGIIAGIIVLGLSRNPDKTKFVRDSLFAIGIPTLVLFIPFGVPFEARVFLETYPSIFLIIGLAIAQRIEPKAAAEEQSNAVS